MYVFDEAALPGVMDDEAPLPGVAAPSVTRPEDKILYDLLVYCKWPEIAAGVVGLWCGALCLNVSCHSIIPSVKYILPLILVCVVHHKVEWTKSFVGQVIVDSLACGCNK